MRPRNLEKEPEEEPVGEAFRFLVTAMGIIVLLSLAHAGVQRMLAPAVHDGLGALTAPFRRGYLLRDPHTLVPSGIGLVARVGAALLTALGGAAIGALAGAAVAGLRRRCEPRPARIGARIGFILVAAWCLGAAVALPSESITLGRNGITIHRRALLWGPLSVPGPVRCRAQDWQVMEELAAGTDGAITLLMKADGARIVIAPARDERETERLRRWLRERLKR